MDRKSRIFFLIFSGIIVGAVVMTFLKYYVLEDYYVSAQAPCDPSTENCFVHTCDPVADGECPEDPVSFYRLVRKKANLIPLCDPNDVQCHALDCSSDEDCRTIFCDGNNVPAGETCNDPAVYRGKHGKGDSAVETEGAAESEQGMDQSTGSDSAGSPEVSGDSNVST